MKHFFNGEIYEIPELGYPYTILNKILVEKEDDEKIPFFAIREDEYKLFIVLGKKVKE